MLWLTRIQKNIKKKGARYFLRVKAYAQLIQYRRHLFFLNLNILRNLKLEIVRLYRSGEVVECQAFQ